MLIGITGKAGVGKDVVAEYLWRKHSFVRIAFADPMKRAAQEIFGLTDEQTWSRELKEVVIPYWGLSPRRMFQMVGTDAMQACFGRDIWIKRWRLSYDIVRFSDSVVVPDIRFNPEAQMVRDLGGVVICVERDTDNGLEGDAKAHVSEAGINDGLITLRLSNNGSFEDIYEAVESFLDVCR